MTVYSVTLDTTTIDVEVDGDPSDAIRVARETLGMENCKVQLAVPVQDATLHPEDAEAAGDAQSEADHIRRVLAENPTATNATVIAALRADGIIVRSAQVTEVRNQLKAAADAAASVGE